MLDELIKFAKLHHEGFAAFENWQIKRFFETVQDTTLILQQDGKIQGFAVYVERQESLYFMTIALTGDFKTNFKNMLKNLHSLSGKPIMWHDEKRRLHKCWLR